MSSKPPIGPVLEHYGWDGIATGYGRWRSTRCPFHVDRHSSARVNEEEGLFRCFAGCGEDKTMDAYDIIQWQEGMDFPSAVERVKELTGFDGEAGRGGGALQRAARLASRNSRLSSWARSVASGDSRLSARRSGRKLA